MASAVGSRTAAGSGAAASGTASGAATHAGSVASAAASDDVAAAADVPPEWRELQRAMAQRVVLTDTFDAGSVRYIGGCDITFSMAEPRQADVCITVVRRSDLTPVLTRHRRCTIDVPFIPGFLAFREAPPLVDMWQEVRRDAARPDSGVVFPDVILVDGNGIMHTRRCGVATQVGVQLGVPTIGVAKTYFIVDGIRGADVKAAADRHLTAFGQWFALLGADGSAWCGVLRSSASAAAGGGRHRKPLLPRVAHYVGDWRDGVLHAAGGAALAAASGGGGGGGAAGGGAAAAAADDDGEWTLVTSSRGTAAARSTAPRDDDGDSRCRPVFVSVGTGVSLPTAVALVTECCVVRVPEPIRVADKASRAVMRE